MIINRKALSLRFPPIHIVERELSRLLRQALGRETLPRNWNYRVFKDNLFKIILFLCAVSSIGIVLFIFGYMLWQGGQQFSDWILNGIWNPSLPSVVAPFGYVFNTLYCSIVGALIGFGIGLPCAIYLAEFSNFRLRNFVKPSLEVLMGFPSVVIGLLILVLLCKTLIQPYTHTSGTCILAAFIALGIMSLPIIISVSEDSLRAVPQDLREASFGLGATRWQTATKVTIPSAFSGISTAFLLALLDVMGETIAVFLVIGPIIPPPITLNPLAGSDVVTALIANLSTQSGETGGVGSLYSLALGLAVVLFILTMITNLAVRVMRGNRTNVGAPGKR